MGTKAIDLAAQPAEIMAFLASMAGPELTLLSADERTQRVTLQTRPNPFSYGVQIQASILPTPRGCRVILDAKRRHPLNLSAGIENAMQTLTTHLQHRFPAPVGEPV